VGNAEINKENTFKKLFKTYSSCTSRQVESTKLNLELLQKCLRRPVANISRKLIRKTYSLLRPALYLIFENLVS